jgi:hypothetical protein
MTFYDAFRKMGLFSCGLFGACASNVMEETLANSDETFEVKTMYKPRQKKLWTVLTLAAIGTVSSAALTFTKVAAQVAADPYPYKYTIDVVPDLKVGEETTSADLGLHAKLEYRVVAWDKGAEASMPASSNWYCTQVPPGWNIDRAHELVGRYWFKVECSKTPDGAGDDHVYLQKNTKGEDGVAYNSYEGFKDSLNCLSAHDYPYVTHAWLTIGEDFYESCGIFVAPPAQ